MTLRAAILALLDRKMAILAELEAINADLADGYAVLGEVPSVRKKKIRTAAPRAVAVPSGPPLRTCRTCAAAPLRPRQRFCDVCRKKKAAAAAAQWRQNHPGYNPRRRPNKAA